MRRAACPLRQTTGRCARWRGARRRTRPRRRRGARPRRLRRRAAPACGGACRWRTFRYGRARTPRARRSRGRPWRRTRSGRGRWLRGTDAGGGPRGRGGRRAARWCGCPWGCGRRRRARRCSRCLCCARCAPCSGHRPRRARGPPAPCRRGGPRSDSLRPSSPGPCASGGCRPRRSRGLQRSRSSG